MVDANYSVSWDDYRKSICHGLSGLQQRGEFVDMTLAADGHRVMAHKMVLSLVSPYIRDLINSADCPHPVIFLSKVSHHTLQSILEYAYTGEVVLAIERIQEFLLACKELRIKGLEENTMESSLQTTLSDNNIQQTNSNVETESHDDNDNDCASGNDDVELDKDLGSALKKPVLKHTSNSNTSDLGLKFTISNQGSAQVVFNRFMYNHRNTRKTGESLWRCLNYVRPVKVNQRCPAFVVLRDNQVVQRACAHNHGFHDDQILRRVRVRNMFTSMKETQEIIEKKEAQKIIEKIEAINQESQQKSSRSPSMEQEIEYIEMPE